MAKLKILVNFDFLKWFYIWAETLFLQQEGEEIIDNRKYRRTKGRKLVSFLYSKSEGENQDGSVILRKKMQIYKTSMDVLGKLLEEIEELNDDEKVKELVEQAQKMLGTYNEDKGSKTSIKDSIAAKNGTVDSFVSDEEVTEEVTEEEEEDNIELEKA